MSRLIAAFTGVALGLFSTTATHAQTSVSVGTLTCTGGEGVGLILGSTKTYDCSFSPLNSETTESYQAKVTKIGLDIGITGTSVIVWSVLSPTQDIQSRALAGTYSGAAADASVGAGGGAKILVGGSGNTISLQPVSVQGQSGVNLAVGVAAMTLQ